MRVDYDKLYKQIRKNSVERVSAAIRDKERKDNYKHVDKYNKEIFEQGIKWFESGLSLDDAPIEIRNNTNFINGFEKGRRLSMIIELQERDSKKR